MATSSEEAVELLELANDSEWNSLGPSERSRKIFVGGLSWITTEETLMNYFKNRDQPVDRVVIMREKMTGRSRGFGFVIAADVDTMEDIVASHHVVDGKKIEAKKAIPKSEMNNPARKIFVGGVALNVDDEQFRAYFGQFGEVVESQIIRDRITRRSRGFGFVTFLKESSVDRVLSQRHLIQSKEVEVKMAEPRKAQPQPVVRHVIQPVLVPAGYLPQIPQQSLRPYEDGGYSFVPPSSLSPPIQYRSVVPEEETMMYPLRQSMGSSWSLPAPLHPHPEEYWRAASPQLYDGDYAPDAGHYYRPPLQRKAHSESEIMQRRPDGYYQSHNPMPRRHRTARADDRGGDLSSSPSDLDLNSLHISALNEREYPDEFSPRSRQTMGRVPSHKEREQVQQHRNPEGDFFYQRAASQRTSPTVAMRAPAVSDHRSPAGRRSSSEWNEIKSLFGSPGGHGSPDDFRGYTYNAGADHDGYYSPEIDHEVYDDARHIRPVYRNGHGSPALAPAYVYEGGTW